MSNGSVLQTMTVAQWLAIPILLVLSGLLTLARADTFGDFTYTTNDTSAIITGYTGPGGNVNIPDVIEGKPVTSIGDMAFYNGTNITGLTFPDSVTTLGSYAFQACRGLTNVVIPNSITSFGTGTFGGCSGLTNVTLPDNITNIADTMFIGCYKLKSITLPDSVLSIGQTAFFDCNNLADINIPDKVTSIGTLAFWSCTSLTNIALPASLAQIGHWVFSGCNNLTTISVDPLNPAYSSIDGVLFTNNQSILLAYPPGKEGEYVVPATVKSIDNSAVKDCLELTGVTLPEGVTNIGPSAFYGCTKLAHINLPDSVTFIDQSAFYRCTSLTNIVIPESVVLSFPSIYFVSVYGESVFARCSSLTNITVDPANTNYSSIDGVLFNKSQSTLLQFPGGKTGSYMIPSTVTAIRESAFAGCAGLTDFAVPTNSVFRTVDGALLDKSLTTLIACPAGKTGSYSITNKVNQLGGFAFSDCVGLTNISISQTITNISRNAFYNCTGLTNIILPNRTKVIMDSAFFGCVGLTSITIPASVTKIESYAFEACSNLTGVYFEGNAPSVITANAPFLDANMATIYYRSGTTGWGTKYADRPTALWDKTEALDLSYQQIGSAYTIIGYMGAGGNVVIPASINGLPVTCIADYAFSYSYGSPAVTSITNITIPNTVTSIGNYAFSRCTALTNMTIPGSVTNIGYDAFNGCTALANITVPPGVAAIASEVFYGCTNLSNISIPDGVTRIGDAAFRSCRALTDVTLPKTVSTIGSAAFADCTSMTNIALPESATSMGSQCFSNCVALWNVTIPNGIINIESNTFYNCSSLTNVTIPDGLTRIGSYAFFGCGRLVNITIPGSVTDIESGVLFGSRVTSVVFEGNAPSFVASNAFGSGSVKIYYYLGTTGWGRFLAGKSTYLIGFNFSLIGSNVTITQYTGSNGSVVIPDIIQDIKVGVIGANAFKGCSTLSDIKMSDNIYTIDSSAFSGCTNLTNVVFGSGITNIRDSVFNACSSLKGIAIPAGVISIGSSVFANCSNLTAVYFAGNAPTPAPAFLFQNATNVTVYYRAGTTGWESTFAGRPTVLWVEQPTYQEWALTVGLLDKYPDASAETDDADQDGMRNLAEMQAGTDPTSPNSKLAFERVSRPNDLVDEDKTAIGSDQHPLFFQTVAGRKYEIQSVTAFGGVWQTETNITATTTQKRVLINKPVDQGFYRVVLVPVP